MHPAVDHAAEYRPDDGDPVAPEIDRQGDGGSDVEQDHEGEEGGISLVDIPAQQPGQDDGMSEAAYRKELGDALKQGQYQGLEE